MNAAPDRAQILAHALALAIMAPTDKHAERAAAMAEDIAQGMSPAEVEACKAAALQLLESPHHDTHRERLHPSRVQIRARPDSRGDPSAHD